MDTWNMSGEECKTPNDWIMTDYSSTFETSPSSKIDYKNFNEYDKLTSSSADLGFESKLDIKLINSTFFSLISILKSQQFEWFYSAIQVAEKRIFVDKQTVDCRNNTHSIRNQRGRNVIEQPIRFAFQWHQYVARIGRFRHFGFDLISISCVDDISRMHTDGQKQVDRVYKQK